MGNYVWDLKLQSLGIFSTFQKGGRSGQNFIIFGQRPMNVLQCDLNMLPKNQIRIKLEWDSKLISL